MDQEQAEAPPFESALNDGTDRFIAYMIEHALSIGRRSSRDFLRHFPPAAIMEALKESPHLRADILEAATGIRRKVALKKSAESSGEDLQIALEEGVAAPEEVIRLFRPDDRVRYLPRGKLWTFLIEGEFWKANKTDKGNYERAQQHIAFLLDRSLKDQLLSHQDIVEGISVNKISQLLPRPELEIALESALAAGRRGRPFSDRDLYESLTAATLTAHIPLPHIWDEVIHPCIALEHGLAQPGSTPSPEEAASGVQSDGSPAPANSNDQPPTTPSARPAALSKVSLNASAGKRSRPNELPPPSHAKLPPAAKLPRLSSEPQADEIQEIDPEDTLIASR